MTGSRPQADPRCTRVSDRAPNYSAEYAAAYQTVVPGVHVHEPAVKAAQMLDQIRRLEARGMISLQQAAFLDVGCGSCRLLTELARAGASGCWGVDPVAPAAEARRVAPGVRVVPAVAEHLPFRCAAFDVVVCSAVLPFVDDQRAALGELVRVARPGGAIVLMVPAKQYEGSPGGLCADHNALGGVMWELGCQELWSVWCRGPVELWAERVVQAYGGLRRRVRREPPSRNDVCVSALHRALSRAMIGLRRLDYALAVGRGRARIVVYGKRRDA